MLNWTLPLKVLGISVLLLSSSLLQANTSTLLKWDELMPADYVLTLSDLLGDFDIDLNNFDIIDDYSPEADAMMDNMLQVLASAPAREDLDGMTIRIPGFVVPLEAEETRVFRFFLVPYFGACIHVPPPPANQIIDVHFEPGTEVENLWDAVWISGTLSVIKYSHAMGTSGYRLDAFAIEAFDWSTANEEEW